MYSIEQPVYNTKDIPAWIFWDECFSDPELDVLQEQAIKADVQAKVGGGNLRLETRRTRLNWLLFDRENDWFYKKISNLIGQVNASFFNYDLSCIAENSQLANYTAEDNGAYDWHADTGKGPVRKLSLVMQLSHPTDYEGGDLELMPFNNNPVKIPKKRGYIVIFPSWVLHRVSPVTYGSRQSLVQWVNGPEFR